MKEVLIFIPGNPSVPKAYTDFFDRIKFHRPKLEIKTLSHMGQNPDIHFSKTEISIKNNFKYHRTEIEKILDQNEYDHVYLMGHSLGATSLIDHYHYYQGRVDGLVLICPFHRITGKAKRFIKIWKYPVLRKTLQQVLWPVARYNLVESKFLSEKFELGDKAKEVGEFLSHPQIFANIFQLLSTYDEHFSSIDYRKQMRELLSENALYLFSEKDFWVPSHVRAAFPAQASRILTGIPHEFPLLKHKSYAVADAIWNDFLSRS